MNRRKRKAAELRARAARLRGEADELRRKVLAELGALPNAAQKHTVDRLPPELDGLRDGPRLLFFADREDS